MHAEVAETFLAGNNRVILAGDAAHRFPPAGGFGMYLLVELFKIAIPFANYDWMPLCLKNS